MTTALVVDKKLLDIIFGPDSVGETPLERAKTSRRLWCRSIDLLAEYQYNGKQTGLMMCSLDALEHFGLATLYEVIDKGSGIIPLNLQELGRSLRLSRERAGLDLSQLAEKAGVSLEEITAAEENRKNTSYWVVYKLCLALGLNPINIGRLTVA